MLCSFDKSLHFINRIIREFDARYQGSSNPMSAEEIGAYRDAVNNAKAEVVSQADVILCTCVSSSSRLLQMSTNIQQVLTTLFFLCKSLQQNITFKFEHC